MTQVETPRLPASGRNHAQGEAEIREWARYRARIVAMLDAGTLKDYWRSIPRRESAERNRLDAQVKRLGRTEVLRRRRAADEAFKEALKEALKDTG